MFKFNILFTVSLIVFSLPTLSHSQTRTLTYASHSHGDYASHTHQVVIKDFDPDAFDPADYSDPHDHDNDHSDVGKKSEGTHSHTFEHSHGEYPSHTHRGTHSHTNPGATHSDPHDIDSSHTHVGKKVVIDPVKKTVTFDPHRHDDYVWHTHTGSYTGNSVDVNNPHDHDNDHSNVDRIPPEPPEGSTPGTPKETPKETPGGTTGGTGETEDGQGGSPGGNPEPRPGKAGTGPSPVTPQPEPTPTPEPTADPKRVLATEWILVDNGRSVPQWIEIWNNNPVEIDLTGWKFHYVSFENFKTKEKIVTLTEFSIPAGEAVILASHATEKKTVAPEQVYNLNIGYVLKTGWKLTTADGIVVHAIGETFTGIERTRPQAGTIEGNFRTPSRISHKNYPSDAPETPHYYGHAGDQAHPAHHALVRAAPSLSRPKQITLWGHLKRRR